MYIQKLLKNQANYETNIHSGGRDTALAISAQNGKKSTILRNKVPET